MIESNKPNKLPSKFKLYILVKLILLLLLMSSPFFLFNKKVGGTVFMFLLFFPGLFAFVYLWLYYHLLTFIVENDKITINSGVIIKHSKSIPFNQVQNVDIAKGLLHRLFGLCKVNIWTSSVGQIQFYKKETTRRPDGTLDILSADGEWLKDFILSRKGLEKTETKVNYCSNCGAKINEGEKFCSRCGSKLG